MSLRPLTSLALAWGVVLSGCGTESPTEPSTSISPVHTAASLATASTSWSAIAPTFGVFATVGVAPNWAGQSIAYVFGGIARDGVTGITTRAYNVATNTWSGKTSEVAAFNLNGVGNIGGKLYFTGGYPEHDGPATSAV